MPARRHLPLTPAWSICLAVALGHPASGQTSQASLELGAARLRQSDLPSTDAVTVGGTVRFDAPRYALAAAGGLTVAEQDRSTAQALLAASLLGRARQQTRWEIGAVVTAFDQGGSSLASGAYLVAREHLTLGQFGGGWAGVALGGVDDLDHWYPTRSAEIGSWLARRGTRVTAAAALIDTRSEPYARAGRLVTDPVTYTDASLDGRWEVRRLDVDARAGLRLISRGALTSTGRGTRPFASVDAAFWITPRLGIVAAIGRQLSDLARATPDTRFASLAVRMTMRDRMTAVLARRTASANRPHLVVLFDSTTPPRIVVTAPGANRVELAASFTGWEAVSLVRRSDSWELDRPLASGTHRLLIRIDGGPWSVPENIPSTDDDLGGKVGLVTVP